MLHIPYQYLRLTSFVLHFILPSQLASLQDMLQGTVHSVSVPAALGCDLIRLDVHQNLLSGPLPVGLAELPNLRSLHAAYNNMEGT